MALLTGPDRDAIAVFESKDDEHEDYRCHDSGHNQHGKDFRLIVTFLSITELLPIVVGRNEEHGKQEAEKDTENIHLRSNHCCN